MKISRVEYHERITHPTIDPALDPHVRLEIFSNIVLGLIKDLAALAGGGRYLDSRTRLPFCREQFDRDVDRVYNYLMEMYE